MRQLIVNADDFNTDGPRSRGILAAIGRGIVTSATVLTNLEATDERRAALAQLAASGAGMGVHLNLTRGRPLHPHAASLIGPDGCFFAKRAAWRRGLARAYDLREAEREFAAQIEAFMAAGCAPDHVDGNNHLHVFPGLAGAAAAAAGRFGIRRIRLPREPLLWSLRQPGMAVLKKCFMSLLCLQAAGVFRRAGLSFPDRFAGLHVPDPARESSLADFLRRLPGGTTELMCHPGYAGRGNTFSGDARERELAGLTAAGVAAAVADSRIRLISFGDISCASHWSRQPSFP